MVCARSPPLATDVLTGQYASGNISDGGPSLLGAILHRLPAGEPLNSSPHLNYLLVLVGLLIADIATTVWFTPLSLPELNPYIAPIAGSFWAQVAYKAPFGLLLVAGTAALAAACDRLRPGAGRWPWVAVIGVYAVPVVHNLVAIVSMGGFE
jgi:hypothetical protein